MAAIGGFTSNLDTSSENLTYGKLETKDIENAMVKCFPLQIEILHGFGFHSSLSWHHYMSGMGIPTTVGKYKLARTIGEGTFAKVKLAINTESYQSVAIKVIEKQMIIENDLQDQVIATKTKIYIVMEYIPGGQLSDKLTYLKRLGEEEARKYFQQLIEAVDYCHQRDVYHRDLKPENLLLDGKGNLKVSDFGLSALRKPGDLLSTACGSPSYVAPEVIAHKKYDGAAVDVWACGVILFELLAGYLPFDDFNLRNLYRKISQAEYACPEWFTVSQRKLLFKILEPKPSQRMIIAEILEDDWFRISYESCTKIESNKYIDVNDINAALNSITDEEKHKTKLASKHPFHETIDKIEVAAKYVRLSVEKMNNSKLKLHQTNKQPRCIRLRANLSAEVIEVTPTDCVIEISKFEGKLTVYKEFCQSLSSLLKENTNSNALETHSLPEVVIGSKNIQDIE
ncbi:hypothetical protein IFM89_004297, partial [Coptis chinensis]